MRLVRHREENNINCSGADGTDIPDKSFCSVLMRMTKIILDECVSYVLRSNMWTLTNLRESHEYASQLMNWTVWHWFRMPFCSPVSIKYEYESIGVTDIEFVLCSHKTAYKPIQKRHQGLECYISVLFGVIFWDITPYSPLNIYCELYLLWRILSSRIWCNAVRGKFTVQVKQLVLEVHAWGGMSALLEV
jgi:hypothetical protein